LILETLPQQFAGVAGKLLRLKICEAV